MQRHYTVNNATGVSTLIAGSGPAPGISSQYYSIKFSELVPELESLSDADCALLLNYGIEMNLRLLPANLCLSFTPMSFSGPVPANGSYSIDNIHVGAVIKDFGKVPRPLTGEVGFKTVHYVK